MISVEEICVNTCVGSFDRGGVSGTSALGAPKPTESGEASEDTGDSDEDDSNKKTSSGKLSKEEQQAILDSINGSMNRSANLDTLLSIYSALKASDIDDEHSAAILVNGMRESSLVPNAGQNSGGAIGIWQWDGGRRDNLQAFSVEHNDTEYTVKSWTIGGIATQVAFMLSEINGNQWIANKLKGLYGSCDYASAEAQLTDKSVDLGSPMNKDTWWACKDTVALSLYFTACFERCAYSIDIYNQGAKQCPEMYKLLTGAEVTGNTDEDLDEDLGEIMVQTGLWDETQFVKWKVMTGNKTLEFDTILEMKEDEIYDIENWKTDLEKQRGDNFLIKGGRWLSILFGIIFEVWMMFIYLAYWFDRLNNFFDFSLLNIVTLGRLRISPDENKCTFSVKTLSNGEVRTINHKKLLGVVIVGLGFGVLIISGMIFTLLRVFVNKVLSILGM